MVEFGQSALRPSWLNRLRWIGDVESGHDNNFNLLRMLAAFGVLVSHAFPLSLGAGVPEPLSLLIGLSLGSLSVVIFFAVSGFYITRSFVRTKSLGRFVRARVLRIFPGLLAVLLVTVLVGAVLTSASPQSYWGAAPAYIFKNLTLVRLEMPLPGLLEAAPYGPAINGSLWTLFYEVVCYIGVVIAGLLGLFHRPRLAFALLFLAITIAAVGIEMGWPGRVGRLALLGLPFMLGAFLYLFRAFIPLSATLLGLLVLLAVFSHGTVAFHLLFTIALTYGVFFFGFFPSDWLLRYNRFGDFSYGTYIYAFPIQQLVASQGVTSPLLNILLAAPLTLICAVLSWHLVENPALKFKSPRKAAPARAAAPGAE